MVAGYGCKGDLVSMKMPWWNTVTVHALGGNHRLMARRLIKQEYPDLYNNTFELHHSKCVLVVGLNDDLARFQGMEHNDMNEKFSKDSLCDVYEVKFNPKCLKT
jgi:hypothetical protein